MADMMAPTNRRTFSLCAVAGESLHPKAKSLMAILETELTAVNYKLCSHCRPTEEDIPGPQSDVITKVRHTAVCDPCLTASTY